MSNSKKIDLKLIWMMSPNNSKQKMDLSLSRITRLLTLLGAPQSRYPVIHVAGTNGKGSVTAYIASVLGTQSDRVGAPKPNKVGRFNSPFLLKPSDSIRINGRPIDAVLFDASNTRVRETDRANGIGCTEFELLASTAFESFAAAGVDVSVVEVGLGGRLDATNVVDPVVSVITSIGMDHMKQLGDTVEAIAGEKAGIVKNDKAVVVGPQLFGGDKVNEVIRAKALEVGAGQVVEVKDLPSWLKNGSSGPYESASHIPAVKKASYTFLGEPFDFELPLRGNIQLENVATAIKALEAVHRYGKQHNDARFVFSTGQVAEGIAKTTWPGRLQWIEDPDFGVVLVDGAHNPQACEGLREYIDEVLEERAAAAEAKGMESDGRVVWVMGMTQGKDVDEIMGALLRPQDMLLTAPFPTPKAMPWIQCVPPGEIALAAKMVSPTVRGTPYEDLGSCLDALASFKKNRPLCVICGSLYLVADVFRRRGWDV
jgi:folylpolyglutamate synthase/dihydrofolate synthase